MFKLTMFNRSKSKDVLKERLKVVISYDRAKISPGQMESLKAELRQVIMRFFPGTEQDIDVSIEHFEERNVRVVASVTTS
ncbi:MAG: cell division topological specificity factor MinE [Deinococcales bacterium]